MVGVTLEAATRVETRRVALISGRGSLLGWRLAGLVLCCVAVLAIGETSSSSLQFGLATGVIYSVAILGSNAIVATLGEINLSMSASMAVGAYTATWLSNHHQSILLSILMAAACAALAGAILAVPTIRLRGVFTALVTFALAFAVPDLITEFSSVTGGEAGSAPNLASPLLGLNLSSPRDILLLCVSVFFILGAASTLLFHSRVGRTLLCIGESPRAAASFGIRRQGWEIGVWAWAGLLGGFAGALEAILIGFLTPSVFPVLLSITILVGSFVGGARSAVGPLLGGLVVGTVPPEIQSIIPASATSLAFGLALLAALITGGAGLGGLLERGLFRGIPLIRRQR